MKIALDVDGTVLTRLEFFIGFMVAMQNQGHEVGYLTARNVSLTEETLEKLSKLGFPTPDFYIGKTDEEKAIFKPTVGNNGTWKAEKMKEHNIDYLYDDFDGWNINYLMAFTLNCPNRLFLIS